MTTAPAADWRLAAVLVILVAVAVLTSLRAGLGVHRDQVVAALRAVAQLSAVALVLTAMMASLAWSFAFVAVMFLVASITSTRRMGAPVGELPWVALAIAAGAGPVVALTLLSGVVPLTGAGVIPIAGIVIGGSMTAATLTGRRAFDELAAQAGGYEAALAVGLHSPQAALLVLEPTAPEALTPGLDQTRTVGLVTLPGAFIGVILGGGTALEAGAAQVLVLIGLLAAQALTTATLLRVIAHARVVRRSLRDSYPR
ncbi:ABC transporter permease [Nocardioides caldifontis]|uniref:ABC transporter permease n=1 Tax=Nocardioides caldifontis TaxID=2588938 RepID=UPI0011E02EC9|nr:ABC transporter permease [Nocardioides caldifontis]